MGLLKNYDVVVVGGSSAGISAALALGRSLRSVLVVDAGQPCNRFAPYAHNFLTRDGTPPAQLLAQGREQLAAYSTVGFLEGEVVAVKAVGETFEVATTGGSVAASKLILATGIRDQIPDTPGFRECWGRTVVHCPYCHGYELRGRKTGVWANGDQAFEWIKLLHQWSDDLVLLTNGPSTLTPEQRAFFQDQGFEVVEGEVEGLDHDQGELQADRLRGGARVELGALYARLPWMLTPLATDLGCRLKAGLVEVDEFQRTSVPGVLACGDIASPLRSLSNAVGRGSLAGVMANHELCLRRYQV